MIANITVLVVKNGRVAIFQDYNPALFSCQMIKFMESNLL